MFELHLGILERSRVLSQRLLADLLLCRKPAEFLTVRCNFMFFQRNVLAEWLSQNTMSLAQELQRTVATSGEN
jgi:hypothetical protein